MRDAASDPEALGLELLRMQRSRLADRLRPPWWYRLGGATVWALFYAGPFTSRSFSSPVSVSTWAIVIPILALCLLMQWGMTRATGIKAGPRPLRILQDGLFYYRPGRRAGIAMGVLSLGGLTAEHFLIDRGLLAVAIVVAVLAVVAQSALQQAMLRAVRQDLRTGGEAA
jgi:hypothetical protein